MRIGGIGVFISRRLTAFLPVRPRPTLSDPPMIAQPTPPYPLPDMPPLELAPPPSTIPSGKTKASEAVTGPAPSTMRGSPLAPELPAPSPAAAQAVPKAGLPEAAPAPSNSTSEPAPAPAAATAPHRDTSEPVCSSLASGQHAVPDPMRAQRCFCHQLQLARSRHARPFAALASWFALLLLSALDSITRASSTGHECFH